MSNNLLKISGIGQKSLEKLEKLSINSILNLVLHLPKAYHDKTRITPIQFLKEDVPALIEGKVIKNSARVFKNKIWTMHIEENDYICKVTFFHFHPAQVKNIKLGQNIRLFGTPKIVGNSFTMTHPEYELSPTVLNENLTPIYSLAKGISQSQFHKWVLQALELTTELPELLPDDILTQENFNNLNEALFEVHNLSPEYSSQELCPGLKRLIFEELLAYQLAMIKIKNNKVLSKEIKFKKINHLPFVKKLGYILTDDQEKVVQDIQDDLIKSYPMQRLIQGDVGCGKTIVAAIAALFVTKQNYQVAYMAPTSLLAEQVANKFKEWFSHLNITLLTGKITPKNKKIITNDLEAGNIDILVGTHAIFQDTVNFKNLALAIIDEQQRFGVAQRLSLRKKSESMVHQLFLSATPIPRTIAMALYADLNISYIKTMPKNRLPINTILLNNNKRIEIVNKINKITQNNEQVYWVCPLVEENEELSLANVTQTYENLKQLLPDVKIGLVHGKSKNKEEIFQEFSQGKTQLLVATTVVEVGMDVPNATLIVIENSERLGLSTLHQLRGRVGRGDKQSFCVLMYQEPLSDNAKTRLEYLRSYSDGFIIAQKDLQLRGFGEIIGTKQTGYSGLQVADLARDHCLVPLAKKWAQKIWKEFPRNSELIIDRWLNNKMEYTVV